MPKQFDKYAIKEAIKGREVEVLSQVGKIPFELLNGKPHPCPNPACPDGPGKDRFRYDTQKKFVFCNQCFNKENGDIESAVGWALGIDYGEVLQKIGDYLQMTPKPAKPQTPAKTSPPKKPLWKPDATPNQDAIALWCKDHKPGTGLGGVLRCQGTTGVYNGKPALGLPMFGADLETITGWAVYHLDGTGIDGKKVKNTAGTTSGIIGTVEVLRRLCEVRTVYKVEGPSDAIALAEAIPELERQNVAVFANGCGGNENPNKTPYKELIEAIAAAGCDFVIVGDNDDSGKDGLAKWGSYAKSKGCKTYTVNLPETIFNCPVNDVRDYFRNGGRFADLDALAKVFMVTSTTSDTTKGKPKSVRRPRLINPACLEEKKIDWLWYNKIPVGCLNLLAGLAGVNKTFWAVYQTAVVTNGWNWADGSPCQKGSVLFFYGEDNIETVYKSRFRANGADQTKIRFLDGIEELQEGKEPGEIALTIKNIEDIEAAITETEKETGLPVRLVIIDPIANYWGDVRENSNAEVRSVLKPLQRLAERTQAAFLLIQHTGKGDKEHAQQRVLGSTGIVASCRTVWGIYSTPEKGHRYFAPLKTNVCVEPTAVEFFVNREDGGRVEIVNASVEKTGDDIEADRREMIRRGPSSDKLGDCKEWLQETLTTGEVEAETVQEDGQKKGFSERTINQAKKELGIKSRKLFSKKWVWFLLGQESPPNPQEEEF